ncbi:hypothetical protein [Amycolatopsis saalfeldensis]|uniref:Uncharacterized protein n=1 Tax=Amycolatopsis saalfeldensis TaxID=394193 RepID=A0A1H8X1M9_9PSEU|nr:hypothetical protein [Amycolatopsis saalfeldensis]SEP33870.1 hypothetical protein SAMN04489732_106173 [Amycolatopsis saalfeldensis]
METVLNLLLIRFGLIAAGVVVLGLVAFAAAVSLRRKGKSDRVRDGVATAARFAGRVLDERHGGGFRARRGGGLGNRVAREAVRRIDNSVGRGDR